MNRLTILATLAGMVVLAAGFWLKFAELDKRPVHFDEATGARIVGYRLAGEGLFDPKHFHGPLLHMVGAGVSNLGFGQKSWEELMIGPLRGVAAGCGLITIALCLACGRSGLAAAAFVASSPLLVYYSRMYIHEPMFLLAASLALYSFWRYWRRPALATAMLAGCAVGSMAATRETFVVAIFAWLGAWGIDLVLHRRDELRSIKLPDIRHLAAAAFAFVLIVVVFYSEFGSNLAGLQSFWQTFFEYETTSGHEKPFWYYLEFLLIPQFALGRWWTEVGVLLLALVNYFAAPAGEQRRECRFLVHAGLLWLLVFSLISYKTPWLIMVGWLHICLAAGWGLGWLGKCSLPAVRVAATAGVVLVVGWQFSRAQLAAIRLADNVRLPYAYVATSKDLPKLASWLEDLAADYPDIRDGVNGVVGTGYWPLPWYLRDVGRFGYWPELPAAAESYPLLLVVDNSITEYPDSHVWLPRGLRYEVPLMVGIRHDLWQDYMSK